MAVRKLNKGSKIGLSIILIIVFLICGFVFWKTYQLKEEREKLDNQLAQIESQIEYEKRQTQAITNDIKYRRTDDYIEDQARDIFGLRDPDETIFKPEEKESSEKKKNE